MMTEIDTSLKIYKSLADRERIRIMSILCKSDSYVELLAEMLELTPRDRVLSSQKIRGRGACEKSATAALCDLFGGS